MRRTTPFLLVTWFAVVSLMTLGTGRTADGECVPRASAEVLPWSYVEFEESLVVRLDGSGSRGGFGPSCVDRVLSFRWHQNGFQRGTIVNPTSPTTDVQIHKVGTYNFILEVTDEDVAAHYEANREDYYISPFVTFTHVFIDGERHSRDDAYALANAKLEELNKEHVQFSDAPRHGDRFPFFVNYVERDPQFVASHFGSAMAQAVFVLEPKVSAWHGPYESEYGLHLVMLTKKAEGRYPELDAVERIVRDDAEREAIASQKEKAIQAIVDTYEVRHTFERPLIGQAQK